jgi:hypothetical protein
MGFDQMVLTRGFGPWVWLRSLSIPIVITSQTNLFLGELNVHRYFICFSDDYEFDEDFMELPLIHFVDMDLNFWNILIYTT